MQEPERRLLSPGRVRVLIPVALFVFALALRLIGIGWGLKNDLHNQSYHPDETDIFLYSQHINPAQLKFTPGFYNYGTLYLSALKVASDMTAAYTGDYDPKNEDSFWSFVARCNLAGRIISAFAGAGTVVLVFFILRRFASVIGSVAGALVLAVAPAHVVHSRFQTVDVTAVFLLAVSALFAFKLMRGPDEEEPPAKIALRWIILSGAFAGLSGGTKYTGILSVLTLLVVLFMCRRANFWKEGLIGLASAAVAFVIATPGSLLDNAQFMKDFSYEIQHTATGHGLVFEGTANGFLYHFGNLIQGFGTIAVLMALVGLGYAAYRRQVWAIAFLAFMLPYYFLIGRADVLFMRYTFPLYVGLAVGFGWMVSKGWGQVGWKRAVVAGGILAIGGVDMGGLMGTVRYTGYMVAEDPRDSAARYLKSQAESNPNALVGLPEDPWFWSPPLFHDSTATRMMPRKKRDEAMKAAVKPRVTYYTDPVTGNPTQFDKRLLTDLKPDFVTYSSFEYEDPERFQGRHDVSDTARAIAGQYKEFLAALQSGYEADKSFGASMPTVQDMEYVQPHVVVWKRKTAP